MSRLLARLQRQRLADEAQRAVERALGESVERRRWVTPTGADAERLRGIPAIGRGVSGAIRGTDPERRACR